MAETKQVIVRVKRQAGPKEAARWEEFSLKWRPSMNVIICLRDIAENPVTRDGKKTTPVSYDSNCLEEICGSCAMLINGKACMACSALVDKLEQPIRIEPMSKFPLVRDLTVDRQFMFESLKRVKAWIPIDGVHRRSEPRCVETSASRLASRVNSHRNPRLGGKQCVVFLPCCALARFYVPASFSPGVLRPMTLPSARRSSTFRRSCWIRTTTPRSVSFPRTTISANAIPTGTWTSHACAKAG